MPKEDLVDKLVAQMRERGVEANVDPRMDSERAGTTFLIFYGTAGEPEPDSEKAGVEYENDHEGAGPGRGEAKARGRYEGDGK
jgi:hypothetical protein